MNDDELASGAVLTGASRAIARDILIHGPRSRAELAQRLRLSPGSLTRLVKPLIDRGLLTEGASVRAGLGQGRPSTPLDASTDTYRFVGFNLTGTGAVGVVVDLRARILKIRRAPFVKRDPDSVCALVASMTKDLMADGRQADALGVGFGGYSPNRSDVFAPFLDWEYVPLAPMLQQATGIPCVVDNDVVSLTEGQHWFGAGRGHDRFAVVAIGAGIGYSLVLHDRIVRNHDADLGVPSHFVIDRSGPFCVQGHRGCASAYLTTRSLAAAAGVVLGRTVSYEEAFDLAVAGNTLVRKVIDEAGIILGRLIASIASLAMLDRVIVFGECARLAKVAESAMLASISDSRPADATPITVDVQETGFSEYARGAAVIGMQNFLLGSD